MDESQIMDDIIDLCLRINKDTVIIYDIFADTCNDSEVKTFWDKMSSDTVLRLEYWQKLKVLSEKTGIPIIFEEPLEIKKELNENLSNIKEMIETDLSKIEIQQKYTLAFKLEFFMLHRAFATFCNFTQNIFSDEKTPADDYEEHLNSFIETLKRHAAFPPNWNLWSLPYAAYGKKSKC